MNICNILAINFLLIKLRKLLINVSSNANYISQVATHTDINRIRKLTTHLHQGNSIITKFPRSKTFSQLYASNKCVGASAVNARERLGCKQDKVPARHSGKRSMPVGVVNVWIRLLDGLTDGNAETGPSQVVVSWRLLLGGQNEFVWNRCCLWEDLKLNAVQLVFQQQTADVEPSRTCEFTTRH